MQIVIEISEDTYKKLTQKSMLMSASAIDEAVDAVKKGTVISKSVETPAFKKFLFDTFTSPISAEKGE